MNTRLKLIISFITFIMIILLVRVYSLSIKSNEYYEHLSVQNYVKRIYTKPIRGIIKDRNGVPLAINNLGFSIEVRPHLESTRTIKRLEAVCELIASQFPDKFTKEELLEKYKKNNSPYKHDNVQLIEFISYDEFFPKYVVLNGNSDLKIDTATKRFYPYKNVGAHVLGYTGRAGTKDIKNDITVKYTNILGKSGLEKFYNDKLQGSLGYRDVKVNALNEEIEIQKEILPSTNNDIETTIDIRLQKYVHDLFGDKAGAVVVMDSNNGEILAAGSFPEFDNNIFVNGVSHKEWQNIINDFNHPFTNKLVNGHYPPGSVVKMGVAHSFMENGLTRNYEVYCTGEMPLGKRKFRCWKEDGHGKVGFTKAIRESCDDFFYKGSLKVGINNIHATLDKYGFGHQTGVDQPNEFKGTNPNKAWKKKKYKMPWYVGETVVSSIGQGFILVTPMQVARYTAGLTNAELPTPHFIKSEELNNKKQKIEIGKRELKLLQKGMYQVSYHPNGTASKYIRSKVKIASKTGTAQVVSIPQSEKKRMKEHELEYFHRSQAWLTTYAPFKNPQYVITILVEHGGHGGSAAGPMVGKIYDKLLELGYIKK